MENKIKKERGNYGENIAVGFLESRGHTILEKNYIAKNIGEIDIITMNDGYIIFVEVKYRTNINFGMPSESITEDKIQKLQNAAECYLLEKGNACALCRFDVIEIFGKETIEINHIENAFWD